MPRHIAIILAGGSGKRAGLERPKQYALLSGRPVIAHSIETFEHHPGIDEVAVVVGEGYQEEIEKMVAVYGWKKVKQVLTGGRERSDSSLAAIKAYTAEDDYLIFHDAARPLVSLAIVDRVISTLNDAVAVGTAVPAVDTIIETHEGRLVHTPDRSRLSRMQTPQAFRRDIIAKAYRLAKSDPTFRATDDCGVVKKYLPDTPIYIVDGEEGNLKLTFAEDLSRLEEIIKRTHSTIITGDNDTPEGRRRYVKAYHRANLRRLQEAELDILRCVADLCHRHHIPYWLDSGTLLGAVRHGGFIPWDDDIDICMPLEELPRFAQLARQELPPHLFVQMPETEPEMRLPICKVRNLNSLIVEGADDFSKSYAKGVYIDIFPMQPWPTLPYKLSKKLAKGYCRANAILKAQHVYSLRSVAELFYFGTKRAIYLATWKLCSLFTSHDKYYSNTLNNSGNGNRHLRTTVFPLTKIQFEGETFSAPADTDRYLRDLFGEYMTLPPEDQREGHATFFVNELIK